MKETFFLEDDTYVKMPIKSSISKHRKICYILCILGDLGFLLPVTKNQNYTSSYKQLFNTLD